MSDLACTCRKGAWDPGCPRHGRPWRLIFVAAFYVLLVLAVVTAQGGAG